MSGNNTTDDSAEVKLALALYVLYMVEAYYIQT